MCVCDWAGVLLQEIGDSILSLTSSLHPYWLIKCLLFFHPEELCRNGGSSFRNTTAKVWQRYGYDPLLVKAFKI